MLLSNIRLINIILAYISQKSIYNRLEDKNQRNYKALTQADLPSERTSRRNEIYLPSPHLLHPPSRKAYKYNGAQRSILDGIFGDLLSCTRRRGELFARRLPPPPLRFPRDALLLSCLSPPADRIFSLLLLLCFRGAAAAL